MHASLAPLLVLLTACSGGAEGAASTPPDAGTQETAGATADGGRVVHGEGRPLAVDATVEAWPTFLGPRRDGTTREAPLDLAFGKEGPPLLWEVPRGEGFATPALADERLVTMSRVGDEVHVDCLAAETGERLWRRSFPCRYEPRFISDAGPRSSPAIDGDQVFVHVVDGRLAALDLATGAVEWERNTTEEYAVGDDFFGVVSSPLVAGDVVVQNVGAPDGPCVAAFDRASGELVWGAGEEWGPSCASPVLDTLAGAERLLVVAGGESRPPTGGLLVLDPADGTVQARYPFRSRTELSVNGASPVVCGDRVFLTAAYNTGSAGLAVAVDGSLEELWTNRRIGLEFSTPAYVDGEVIAIDGVSGRAGAIVALDPTTGEELARESLSFQAAVGTGADRRERSTSVGAGSLLAVDGGLLVLGDTGHLAFVRRTEDGFAVEAEALLFFASETWTPPVIHRGLLYVQQNDPGLLDDTQPRLLCYDVRGTAR